MKKGSIQRKILIHNKQNSLEVFQTSRPLEVLHTSRDLEDPDSQIPNTPLSKATHGSAN